MMHRQLKGAKILFSLMVPVTLLAFFLGSTIVRTRSDAYWSDWVALILTFAGVFFYNFFEEKAQKTSIETL